VAVGADITAVGRIESDLGVLLDDQDADAEFGGLRHRFIDIRHQLRQRNDENRADERTSKTVLQYLLQLHSLLDCKA